MSDAEKRHRQEIGQRIKEARERKGLTQPELTRAVLGTDRAATVADWESGKRMPDAPTFGRLADVLGETADWLLGRDVPTRPASVGELLEIETTLLRAHRRVAEIRARYEAAAPEEEPTGRAEGAGDETQRRLAEAAQNQAVAARLRAEQQGKENPVRRRAAGDG